MPSRNAPKAVVLGLRHRQAQWLRAAKVDGQAWKQVDPRGEITRLSGL